MQKMKKRVLPVLVMSMLAAALCGLNAAAAGSHTEGVTTGKKVFIHESGVVFWGWEEELWSGLLDDSGNIYDFVQEFTMPETISTVAVEGNYLYLDTHSGLYRVSLEDYQQGTSVAKQLYDSMLIKGFQLYGGYAYYLSGSNLYRVPVEGGEAEKLASGVEDTELAAEGIYYTDEDGGLFLAAHDGSDRDFIVDTPYESSLVLYGDFIYFWGEEDDCIRQYSLADGSLRELQLQNDLKCIDYIQVTDDYLIYVSEEDGDGYRYDFATGQEERLERYYGLMDKPDGLFYNDMIYYGFSDVIYWYDVEAQQKQTVEKEDVVSGAYTQSSGGTSAGGSVSGSGSSAGGSASGSNAPAGGSASGSDASADGNTSGGSFNIAEDIVARASEGSAFVSSKYFTLYLPFDINWNWEEVDNNTIRFYYVPAYEAGYGGTAVTIEAYDRGDSSYESLPAWRLAGLGEDKTYVAIFPTDLQCDPNDSAQYDEYMELSEYVRRISYGETDNPFSVNVW